MKKLYLLFLAIALLISSAILLFHMLNAKNYIENKIKQRRARNEIMEVYYQDKYCPQTPELCLNYKLNSRRDND